MMGHRGMLEQETSKPRSVGPTLRRLARYFGPYWPVLIGVLVLMILSSWTQVLTPELSGQAVDCYLTPAITSQADAAATAAAAQAGGAQAGGAQAPAAAVQAAAPKNCWFGNVPAGAPLGDYVAGLTRLVLGLVGVYLLGSLSSGLMFFAMGWAGQHVLRKLQTEVFDHLHELSLGFYSRNESGDLMSRITNDTSTIQQAIGFALINVLSGSLLIVWIAWVMLSMNWVYGLLSLAVAPIMAVATVWFSGQARKAFRRTRREIGNVNAELEESISGVREAQAFAREEANIESFRQSNAANRDANVRAVAYTAALAPVLEALGYVAIAIVAGVGGVLMLQGQTLGGAAVSTLLADGRGAVWAGAGDQLFPIGVPDGIVLTAPSDLPDAIVSDMAFAGDALWLATADGVARFDGRWRTFTAADGLAGDEAQALAVAPDGSLWAAFDTPLRGLSRYAGGTWRTVSCPTAAPSGARVLAAAQTPGAIWLATDAGVNRYDGEGWVAFGPRDGLAPGPVLALAATGDTVWAGGVRGVARFDGVRWQVVADIPAELLAVAPGGQPWVWGGNRLHKLGAGPGIELPLPTAVRALAATEDAAWLATADGVLRYDGDWTVFTTAEGLPANDVTAISAVGGQVWAAASSDERGIDLSGWTAGAGGRTPAATRRPSN